MEARTKIATNNSVTASSTQSNLYDGSHHWNSNTDSLLYAQQGNDLVFGTGDFTIEFWFYDDNGHNGNNNRCVLFDNRRGGNVQGDPPQLVGYVDSHNEINLYYANGSEINITVPSTVGKWWIQCVRSSGTTKLYIDGVEVGSASDTTNYPNNGIALGSGTDSGETLGLDISKTSVSIKPQNTLATSFQHQPNQIFSQTLHQV